MNFWEENIRILRERFAGLEEKLLEAEGSENTDPTAKGGEDSVGIEETPSGCPTLRFRGVYIHSRRSPEREAKRLTESFLAEEGGRGSGPIVILGFALGYLAEEAAATGRPLIIVEKHPAIIKAALETRDLSSFLSRNELIFIIGGESGGVLGALQLYSETPFVIKTKTLTDLDAAWYGEVLDYIRTFKKRDEINLATLRRFGRRWVRNLGKNKAAIRDLPGISFLEGAGGDFPVFLAAAGPSLDDSGPLLPHIRERCVIVAVDTSLRFFLERSVVPDFVVTVDPQFWNARHLDRCFAPKSILIAESAVYPHVLRNNFEKVFLCSSLFPLGRYLEDRVDPKGVLGAGGSVATTAWDFARVLGSRKIWTAGLDLAFTGYKSHFRGARFETMALAGSNRFEGAELLSFRTLRGGGPLTAPALDGTKVLTDERLSLYSKWFALQFSRHPETENYSLSSGGLAVPGLIPSSREAILALPPKRSEIDSAVKTAVSRAEREFFSEEAREKRRASYEMARNDLEAALTELIAIARAAAEKAEAGWKNASLYSAAKMNALLGEMEKTNEFIGRSKAKDVAGFLFPPLAGLEAELKTPAADSLRRHLELSFKLYRALAQAAKTSREELEG